MRWPSAKKITTAAMLVGSVALFAPAVAQATSWGPSQSYYNGTSRVDGSGDFVNDAATYAVNNIWLNDPSDDGNNVYVSTTFEYYYTDGSAGQTAPTWNDDTTKSTSEYNYSNTPITTSVSDGLNSQASSARGSIQACAQMGWPVPDSCSDSAYPGFSY